MHGVRDWGTDLMMGLHELLALCGWLPYDGVIVFWLSSEIDMSLE